MATIRSYKELRVFQAAMDAGMEVFHLTKSISPEEKYSMVDQMRRASRSVSTNIGEAWRRRRTAAHFVSKLNDSEAEAGELQVWLEYALRCQYISADTAKRLDDTYDKIIAQLVKMENEPEQWIIRQ